MPDRGALGLASLAVSDAVAQPGEPFDPAEVVAALRRARRRQRVAAIHWVDALYQVYVTGLVAVVGIVIASGAIGDEKVSADALVDVRAHGPALLGTLAALAVFMGARSGSRGGPLALERADVRHVLLSPVDRGVALRGPAWRQLRFLSLVGAGVGAAAGQLALRRFPGNPAEWMAVGAAFGVVLVGLAIGSALVTSGLGVRSWISTLAGGALVAWSVADLFDAAPTAPGTLVGRLPLWPLRTDPVALVGPLAAAGLVLAGMSLLAGTSLEAAERRTALVGQLRFAVTLQDLRTVLVLRRQLAQERPRSRPWIRAGRRPARFVVWQRGLRSLARWPASRILRVVVLAAVAGLSLRGAWSGTTPLLLAAGGALWIAALDAAEPLGQEVDHPGRTDAYPDPRCLLFFRHLPVVAAVSVLTGLAAGLVAATPIGHHLPLDVALLVGAVAGLLAGCGAVVSVVQGAPDAVDVLAMATPEIAGARTVTRTAWPPGLAVLGTLPLLAARASVEGVQDPPPLAAAATAVLPLLVVAFLLAGWVRFRDDIHRWMADAAEQMSPSKALERQAAERQGEADREAEALRESRRIAGLPVDDDEADTDEGDDVDPAPKPKPKPKPPAKPKPNPAPTVPGTQGGTSAKPIGRRRDQKP